MLPKRSKLEWRTVRQEYLDSLRANRGVDLRLTKGAWAVAGDGRWIALPGVTATAKPDVWWLGVMHDELVARRAAGVILLCAEANEPLRDFGLPASLLAEIEPQLSKTARPPQLHFTVVRRDGRFLLQLKGGRTLDITERLGDVSWIEASSRPTDVTDSRGGHSLVAETAEPSAMRPSTGEPGWTSADTTASSDERRFFARAGSSGLEPIDPVELAPGATYLVRITPVPGVPRSTALRRMLARGGPGDLPRDLAAQHDHYAHGAPKR